MDADSRWLEEKLGIEETYGPWTAHNIDLGHGLFTIREGVPGEALKLRRVLQIVSDLVGGQLDGLRVLDLACLEGLYAIEFARHGAQACAIEGREQNLEKARFAARVLGLEQIGFYQDDVRNLCEERYGSFDVVLCLGILYHLDAPDVFDFLKSIYHVCRGFLIIDTHISLEPLESYSYEGREYWGRTVFEHEPDASEEEVSNNLWASLDNPSSVHLTLSSLCNVLSHLGFSSVYECYVPEEPTKPENRVTLLAVKGQRGQPVACPPMPEGFVYDLPEPAVPPKVKPGLRTLERIVPARIKNVIKSILFVEQQD